MQKTIKIKEKVCPECKKLGILTYTETTELELRCTNNECKNKNKIYDRIIL